MLGEKAKPIDTGIKNYKVFHNISDMSEATVQKCVVDKTRGDDGQARRATSQPRPPQVGEASDAADDVPREAPEPIHTECHVSYQKEDRAEAQMEKPGQKELRKALAPISCARLNETRVTKDNLETAGFYSSGAVVKHDTDEPAQAEIAFNEKDPQANDGHDEYWIGTTARALEERRRVPPPVMLYLPYCVPATLNVQHGGDAKQAS